LLANHRLTLTERFNSTRFWALGRWSVQ